jgi:glycosyltransferase involved in cell wall biosynthesis
MKVLHIISTLGIGGAETLVSELAVSQKIAGLNVAVYVLVKTGTHLEDQLVKNGVPVTYGVGGWYSFRQLIPLSKYVKVFKPDIVHSHLTPAQLWSALISHPRRLTTEHSTFNRRRKFVFKVFDSWMYSQYRVIACISRATANALGEWIPLIFNRITVVTNGIDIERFQNASAAKLSQISTKKRIIMMVARLEIPKDHFTLIRAVDMLPNTQLFLIGDGKLRLELETLITELGLNSRVFLLGKRSDIPHLLKCADIYVHSSEWEGFGIAVLEAMAAGLPIVATDVPGLADLVGQSGILFPVKDFKSLAKSLSQILNDEMLMSKYSALSKAKAQEFSLQKTMMDYLKLYEEILS